MYALFNLLGGWALTLFSRQIVVDGTVPDEGPLLLLANHPNGFLDGIVIASKLSRPVHFLGRGDLFQNRVLWRMLKPFHVLPLYPAGKDPRLRLMNESGMDKCREVWEQNGVVLIFAEGESTPGWGLNKIKKTAFRLLSTGTAEGAGSKVKWQPAGIHYHPFRGVNKNILLRFGDVNRPMVQLKTTELPAGRMAAFQQDLRDKLSASLCKDSSEMAAWFRQPVLVLNRIFLLVPAAIGYLLHAPLYLIAKGSVNRSVKRTEFRESALFLALFFSYPVYWILINVSLWIGFHCILLSLIFLLMPLWARVYILHKKRLL